MATVRGRDAVKRYIASIPPAMRDKILRGAAKAAAKVVADEARLRLGERTYETKTGAKIPLRDKIVTRSKKDDGDQVTVKITLKKGFGYSVGVWLEYGTAPHFISVDDSQRQGMTPKRINTLRKEGSLVINGQFVGATVFHPGARPYPFLRPALDTKEVEAIKAAQGYITTRIAREGLGGSEVGDDDE